MEFQMVEIRGATVRVRIPFRIEGESAGLFYTIRSLASIGHMGGFQTDNPQGGVPGLEMRPTQPSDQQADTTARDSPMCHFPSPPFPHLQIPIAHARSGW
jgi:hypothetical protein